MPFYFSRHLECHLSPLLPVTIPESVLASRKCEWLRQIESEKSVFSFLPLFYFPSSLPFLFSFLSFVSYFHQLLAQGLILRTEFTFPSNDWLLTSFSSFPLLLIFHFPPPPTHLPLPSYFSFLGVADKCHSLTHVENMKESGFHLLFIFSFLSSVPRTCDNVVNVHHQLLCMIVNSRQGDEQSTMIALKLNEHRKTWWERERE